MTEYNKVFLDTAPVIYFLDQTPELGNTTLHIFEEIIRSNKPIITSVITVEEYLVYPYRNGIPEKEEAFFDFTGDFGINILPITLNIAKRAAMIRAKYEHFKAMDALQLAAAVESGCDLFLTNDNQLKQFSEIRCITVEDWQ